MPRIRLISAPYYTLQRLCAFHLFLIILVTPACAHDTRRNYFPLTDNARWEYAGRFNSSNGKQFNVRATVRIEGETLINGKRYFKFITASDFSGVPEIGKKIEDVRYYRVTDNGIFVRPGNDAEKPDLLEIPLPIPIGVKWLSGATEVQAERVGSISINGREYKDCLKITFRLADGVRTNVSYLAPDVGVIKYLYVNTTPPQSTAELTLENYKL